MVGDEKYREITTFDRNFSRSCGAKKIILYTGDNSTQYNMQP